MPIDKEQQALTKQKKLLVDFREVSLRGSQIYSGTGCPDYNPDSLASRKGLTIYSKMREDDQIKAVLTMKKFARLMTPWEVQPASQDAMDVEIADFVTTNLQNLAGTFEDNLMEIYTALDYGYSISEKLWYRIEKGKFAGKIGLKALKTREPFHYVFESDPFGNLKDDGIIYQGPVPADLQRPNTDNSIMSVLNRQQFNYRLPTDKFVIYSYSKEFNNYYGRSDLRSAYRSWWSKEILIRFMNIYMERFGMPTHVAKYPKNMGKTDRETLRDVIDKVQAKYSIVIPEDVVIELLQVGGGGETAYRNAIEMHNKFMSRSILVPDLMGFNTVSGGGSYALGKKHFDVFLWILQKLGRDTEESIVGEQIIKQLVDFNYSNVEDYPKFKFEAITAEGTATRANIIQMGVMGGFINPEEGWIRDYLALPKHDEKFALGIPQQSLPGAPGGMQGGVGRVGMDEGQGQVDEGEELLEEGDESIDKGKEGLKDGEDVRQDKLIAKQDEEFRVSKGYSEAIKLWKAKKYADDDKKIQTIPISKIKTKPGQLDFADGEKIKGLVAQLQRGEELSPISVDKDYNLLNGRHRLLAYKTAGIEEIPVDIAKDTLDITSQMRVEEKPKVVQFQKNSLPLDNRFDYKIDYKKMEEDLDEYEGETVTVLSDIIKAQKDALLKTVERKKLVEDKDYSGVNALQLKFVGDFKKAIQNRLIKLYLDSKLEALREIAEGQDNITIVTKFATSTIQLWMPVEPTEAIDFFNRKVLAKIVTKAGIKKLLTLATRKELQYYDAKAFAIAGIERDTILKKAKLILLDALKAGDPKGAQYGLGKLFDEYLTTGEIVDDELVTPHRLETIVRTNFNEAFNAGRRAMMDDPDVADFVPFVRYSAVLDPRVRPSHAAMHGRIFTRTNPIVDIIQPPSGYNCRCLLTAVTKIEVDRLIAKGDGIELSDNDPLPPNFPDQGFGRYSSLTKSITVTVDVPELGIDEKGLQDSITELKNKLSVLESSMLEAKNTNSNEKIVEITTLRTEREALMQKITELEKQVSSLKNTSGEVVSLQFNLDNLRTENNALQNSVNALKNNNVQMITELGLSQENKGIQISSLLQKQADLQAQINTLEVNLQNKNKLQLDNAVLLQQVTTLQEKIATLEDNIYTKEKTLNKDADVYRIEKQLLESRIMQLEKELNEYNTRVTNNKAIPRKKSEVQIVGDKEDVIKCPYTNCGESDISVTEDYQGTKLIHCNVCLNNSKITKEGDVYLQDKVRGIWIKEDFKMFPNAITGHRTYDINGISEQKKDIAKCPYTNCGSNKLDLLEQDRFKTLWYRCVSCKNEFKVTVEGQLYLFDKIKNEWVQQSSEIQPDNITGEK